MNNNWAQALSTLALAKRANGKTLNPQIQELLFFHRVNRNQNRNGNNFRSFNMRGLESTKPVIIFQNGQILARTSGGGFLSNGASHVVVGKYSDNGIVRIDRQLQGPTAADFIEDIVEQLIMRKQQQPMRIIMATPIMLNDLEIGKAMRSRMALMRKPGYYELVYDPRIDTLRALLKQGNSLGLSKAYNNVNVLNMRQKTNGSLKETTQMIKMLTKVLTKLENINGLKKKVDNINRRVIKIKERTKKK